MTPYFHEKATFQHHSQTTCHQLRAEHHNTLTDSWTMSGNESIVWVDELHQDELIHRLLNDHASHPNDRRLVKEKSLELVLVRTIVKLVNGHSKSDYKTHHEAFAAADRVMSLSKLVCHNWWQTMNGWLQSNTRHWLRHRLQHSVQSK